MPRSLSRRRTTDWIGRVAAGLILSSALIRVPAAMADMTCRAEVDRRQAAIGETVVLTLHAACPGSQPPQHEAPVIPGVDVVTGATSQSFSLDAGGSSIAITAVYYLRSRSGADFRIPSIVFRAGQWQCETEPIEIGITGSGAGSGATPQRQSDRTTETAASRKRAGRPGDPVFITLEVDSDEVWVGQQIILTFRYHRLRNTWGQPSYTPPRTEGFWRLDLAPERTYRQAVAGQFYEVTEIRYALFATRAGDLLIEPARLTLTGDPFGRFFGRGAGQQQLATDSLTIRVADWPAPRPPGFSGFAADRLEFTADLDRRQVARGEPVTLSLRVSADAFLKGFQGFEVPEPPGARIFDAAERLREDTSGARYMAVFDQEKAVVPLREGTLTLPPLQLVYFDTAEGSYRTVLASAPTLRVTPSDLPVAGDDPSGFRRAEIARIGHDLAFVHPAAGPLRRHGPLLVERVIWWVAILGPWCLLGGYRWHLRRRAMADRDPAGQRQRRAWQQARRILRRLHRHGGQAGELTQAILGYVADHVNRSPAGLTAGEVQSWFEGHGQARAGRRITAVLAACDEVRFAGQGSVDVPAFAKELLDLLACFEKARATAARATRGKTRRWPSMLIVLPCHLLLIFSAGPDPARLLAEGNQAYTAGDLDTALHLYVEALDAGVDDAVLHYNLGNTLVRRGELGRAIASYLRAQRLAPRDRDVRANLDWVRSNTRDLELVDDGLPPVVAQLDEAARLLALDEWAQVLVFLSWLIVLQVAWTWRRGELSAAWRRWRLALVTAALLAAIAVTTRWYAEVLREVAVVVVQEVAVRSGPAESFPAVFRVHDGLVLQIRGERDEWARIGLGGDWVGWVPVDALERVSRR